jgi:hypothetical protein
VNNKDIKRKINESRSKEEIEKFHALVYDKLKSLFRERFAMSTLLVLTTFYLVSKNYWQALDLNLLIIQLKPGKGTDIIAFCSLVYLNFRTANINRDLNSLQRIYSSLNDRLFSTLGGSDLSRLLFPFSNFESSLGKIKKGGVLAGITNLIQYIPFMLLLITPFIVQVVFTYRMYLLIDNHIIYRVVILFSGYFIFLMFKGEFGD